MGLLGMGLVPPRTLTYPSSAAEHDPIGTDYQRNKYCLLGLSAVSYNAIRELRITRSIAIADHY